MGKPKRSKAGAGREGGSSKLKKVGKKSKTVFKKSTKKTGKGQQTSGKAKKAVKGVLHKKESSSLKRKSSGLSAEGSSKKVRVESGAEDIAKKSTGSRGVVKNNAGNDRAKQKARLVHRRSGRQSYELVRESKLIWEHLRQHENIPSRTLALEEMMALAHGHFKELALKHDTARVVQSCLKHGNAQHRADILAELKDLCKLKYASFVVKSLLRYCSAEGRGEIIASLYGHVRKLIRRSEASEVVEFAYNEYANLEQRTALVLEFYGSEFALFKDDVIPGHTSSPPLRQDVLGDVLTQHPDKATKILLHMRDSLMPLIDKEVIKHSIVHRALLDYIRHCSPQARSELIECVREHLPHLLHTKEGSRLTMHCLWDGTAKDRKVIVKSLKGLVGKVCSEEHGHLVLLALFDSVDDTVLVRKVILSEIVSDLEGISSTHYGRRVLLYLLAPRSPRHFTSQFVDILSVGDSNPHSKKLPDVRRRELREGVAPALLSLATDHAVKWVQSKTHSLLFLEVMLCEGGEGGDALRQALVDALCGEEGVAVMDDAHTHYVLGRVLQVEMSPCDDDSVQCVCTGFFGELLSTASEEVIRSWVQGSFRASYLLARVLDTDMSEWAEFRKKVRSSLVQVAKQLEKSPDKAHQLISTKLSLKV